MKNKSEFKIGITLSAGGAKGIAHVGVLKALYDAGVFPSVISGASMGSVVGGLCALGKHPGEMIKILNEFDNSVIKDLTRFKLSLEGVMDAKKMREILFRLFDSKRFKDLKIPFYCTAYDIDRLSR